MSSEMERQLAILKEKYIASLPEKVGSVCMLWESISEDNDATRLEELHRMAHSLSGSGATYDQVQLSQSAKKLELCIKDHMAAGDIFDDVTKDEITVLLDLLVDSISTLQ